MWKKIGLVKRLVLGVSTVGLSWLTISPAYSAQASAPTSTEMEFAIPAGSLADALTRFGRQTGIQISVNGDLARSMKSGGVSGEMTPDAALAHVLAGTGLVAHRSSSQNILIQKTSSAIMLGPVRVGGNISHQQDPSGPGVGYVATRTMTGSKTDTPIIEIPNSIHVITKQQMIDQQPQNVMEALRYMPGVSVEAFGAFGNGPASGLNPGAIQQRGFDTSQFVDGLRSYSNSAGETAFLERIEVMNGPSSVMYGQSTPGGMINMSLKKPTETPLHNATVGFGNWGRYEATVDVSDKINKSGSVKYRIAAIGVTQGSQTDHVNYHRVGILPSISWNIDEKTNLAFVGSYMYTPGDGTNWTQLPPEILLNSNHNGRIPRSRFLGDPRWNVSGQKDAFIEYQFQHKFNKWIDFSQNLRWERSESFEKRLTRGRIILPDQYGRAAYEGGGLDSTVGLDTRVGGKFSIKNVHNTWLVGTDFRQYNDKNGTTSDHTMGYDGFPGSNGYSFVNVYDPQSNYVPCINVHSKTCRNTSYSGKNSYFQEGVYFQDQIKW
ncbi:ferrichrysobactin receptor, partial [Acetobacter cerevisiae]